MMRFKGDKPTMKTKRITSFLLVFTLLTFALTAAFLTPVQTVSAQGLQTRTPDPDKLAKLAEYFQKEKDWLNKQATHLQTAYEGAAKVQELIDAARAEGKDVSALEAALAAYNGGLAQAQAEHDNAANIIAAHNGFDDGGGVVDVEAARQTTRSARLSLNDAHIELAQSVHALRQALQDWRAANQ
jgi:post-segregation antitoxin (ccd killing protein)